ncbi:MAG TPA: LPS assembly lipoprotein LptE [Myxococcota bacterium]|nr:LPS assembly lipoprotein LptE [Myxococcota bacterium]
MSRWRAGLWLAVVLALSGCGYQALNGRNPFGPGAQSIELKSFENDTREPGLEQLVGEAMNEEFARRGLLKPQLEGQGAADLVLRGTLLSATVHSSSYSSGALALEEGIDVAFNVSVHRVSNGELVWQHNDLHMREVFLSSADPQVYVSNKEQALRRISSEIAERVHDELFQKF